MSFFLLDITWGQVRADLERRAGGNPSWNVGVDYGRQLAHSPNRDLVRRAYREAGLSLHADLHRLAAARGSGRTPAPAPIWPGTAARGASPRGRSSPCTRSATAASHPRTNTSTRSGSGGPATPESCASTSSTAPGTACTHPPKRSPPTGRCSPGSTPDTGIAPVPVS